jgi:hypothetical protein
MLEDAIVLTSITLVDEIDVGVSVAGFIELSLRAEQEVPTVNSLPIVQFAVSPPMF